MAEAIRRDFAGLDASPPPAWDAAPPVKVIDCVLSLNRPYKTVVAPRVDAFARDHARVETCIALRDLIESFESPAGFMQEFLDLRDARRAKTLVGVTDYVIDVQSRFDGCDEESRMRRWAEWARPGDYLAVGVPGFGLAGFQYLRMLFGADTTKPDVHICRYVAKVLHRDISEIEALYLLERAADLAGISLARVDSAIWTRATGHADVPPSAP